MIGKNYRKDPSGNKLNKNTTSTSTIDYYIDPEKVGKRQKDELIKIIQTKLRLLNLRLMKSEELYKRQIENLYYQIEKLIYDPTLILPSGNIISYSSLTPEQLKYLEELYRIKIV